MADDLVLEWEEHYSYKFTLTEIGNNPFNTGPTVRRYSVSTDTEAIGRITQEGDMWKAYSYRILDEYSQRIGYFDSIEEACKALEEFELGW